MTLPNYKLFCSGKNNRTAIAVPNDLCAWAVTELSDEDTTVIMLENTDKETILITSSYLDITLDSVISDTLQKVLDFSRVKNIPILIGCDSNSHSTLWGCDSNNARGDIVEEWILHNELSIINSGNVKTFVSTRGSSIIDLTLASPCLLTQIKGWYVEEKYQFSDHRKIVFHLDFCTSKELWSQDLKKADWTKFRMILKTLPKLNAPLTWKMFN